MRTNPGYPALALALALISCADTRTFKDNTPAPTTVYYRSCDDAPGELAQGDPGYRLGLDRDRDGRACDGG